jgi:hypothetical protein
MTKGANKLRSGYTYLPCQHGVRPSLNRDTTCKTTTEQQPHCVNMLATNQQQQLQQPDMNQRTAAQSAANATDQQPIKT